MPPSVLINALRELLRAAAHFEKKAANHERIETERKALVDAITQAQLVLSVTDAEVKSPPSRGSEAEAPSLLPVRLTSVKGGKAKSKAPPIRPKPLKK